MENKQFWMEFLDMYKERTELWRRTNNEDESLKDDGYNILLRKIQEVMPEATKEVLIKKLNIFRSSYRRENRKIKESMKSGSSQAEIYKPKWIYFEKLKFLEEKDDDTNILSSLDNEFIFNKTPKKNEAESEFLDVAKKHLKMEINPPESGDAYLFKWWYEKFEKLEGDQKELAQRICLDVGFAAARGSLNDDIMNKFHNSLPVRPST